MYLFDMKITHHREIAVEVVSLDGKLDLFGQRIKRAVRDIDSKLLIRVEDVFCRSF